MIICDILDLATCVPFSLFFGFYVMCVCLPVCLLAYMSLCRFVFLSLFHGKFVLVFLLSEYPYPDTDSTSENKNRIWFRLSRK